MVLLVPKTYAAIALAFDLIMLTTALLFRKPKHRHVNSTLDLNSTRLVGYYLVVSAVIVLVISHLTICFHNYVCYFVGLSLLSLIFYLGMVMVHG